ncbi:unnamed protein product [Paramecium sonneborni]|uniref:Uncharacterized protein n=1 Tax=Paramecium sonneborni TaxID=65129 RepID=A0A8S1MK08_9CILI|nr:unnamed protein product [Paramecium sonneborni]
MCGQIIQAMKENDKNKQMDLVKTLGANGRKYVKKYCFCLANKQSLFVKFFFNFRANIFLLKLKAI